MNYQQLKTYVEGFVSHVSINKAMLASLDELLGGMKTSLTPDNYPLLFVTEPIKDTSTNAADTTIHKVTLSFSIFKKYEKQHTFEDRSNTLIELEPVMNDVIAKIDFDIDELAFPVKQYAEVQGRGPNIAEPIGPARLIGWTYELEFQFQSTIAHNPANWI